jgi:hypothetical protein
MTNQILLLKGWEGFADRLQVLSHCLNYCKINDASICIDWRDIMWGQETFDFHDYFEIVGIPVVPLSEVIERVSNGATFLPSCWNLEMISEIPNERMHFPESTCDYDDKYSKLDVDIVINNCVGVRTWHINNLLSNIRLTKSVSDIICKRLENLESPYTVVHLRGTDRLSNLPLDEAIQPAIEALKKEPIHVLARMYVLSDMKSMIDLWLHKFPKTKTIYNNYEIHKLPNLTQGTHQLPKEVLDFYDMKKYNMNIDTITDFLVICFSDWTIGNSKESIFTTFGKFIKQGGKRGVSKWVHGFIPQQNKL